MRPTDIPTYLSGAIFMKAYRILRLQVATCLERYELSPTAWVLLGVLANSKQGVRLAAMAEALNVKAPLITMIADRLIAQGLINRVENNHDKRSKLLVLTPDGRRFVKQVERDMQKTLARLLKGLGVQELEAYKTVLETIIANDELK